MNTDENVTLMKEPVPKNRRLTIRKDANMFGTSHVSAESTLKGNLNVHECCTI
jgi:hypothetical protein